MRQVTGSALLMVPTSAPWEAELCAMQGSGARSGDAERNKTLANGSVPTLPLCDVKSVTYSI